MKFRYVSIALFTALTLCAQDAWALSSQSTQATKSSAVKVSPKRFSFDGIFLGDTLLSVKERHKDSLSNVPSRPHKWITHGKVLGHSVPYIFEFSNADLLQEITLTCEFDDYKSTLDFFNACSKDFSDKYGEPTNQIREYDGGYEAGDGQEEAAMDEGLASIEDVWEHNDGESLAVCITPEHMVMMTFYKSTLK